MNKRDKLMEEIWVTYHPKLQIYLKQIFPNTWDIEERVSVILLKIFDKLDTYNPKYALSTWVYRIARNMQIDDIRKANLTTVDIEHQIIQNNNTPEILCIKEFEQKSIKEAINTLNSQERELIYLHYYEEYKYREISEITGVPEGTLKFRMSCAKKKLKTIITRREIYEKQN